MDFEKNIGKKVRNKVTGKIRTVLSRGTGTSVILADKDGNRENWIGFEEGSQVSKEWEEFKEEEEDWCLTNLREHPSVLLRDNDQCAFKFEDVKKLKSKLLEDFGILIYQEIGMPEMSNFQKGLKKILNERFGF